MVASLTELPVIGVPVLTSSLSGLDSLLSIVQMPRGIPVATVAINNARNAGLLAARILGIESSSVRQKLASYRAAAANEVEEKARKLESTGYREYLRDAEERG
jgi:5-(carboxyamino)imidazole ribonucleotide mutase